MTFYTIRSFDGGAPEREEFERFAAEHYRDDPFFRPPPSPPDSARCFLLYDAAGQACGRAAVTVNPGIEFEGKKTALIGWYECVEDSAAANALLEEATAHANRIGAEYLLGPMNGDTWHSYRIALPSPFPPFFLEPYNKPWYATQFLGAGFAPVASYHSSNIPAGAEVGVEERTQRFAEEGITIRELDPERFDREVERIYAVSVEAFRPNPFYTPISLEETLAMYRPLQGIVEPAFAILAEDADGETVGFAFAVRNLYAPPGDSLVVKTAAVLPSQFGKGLGSLLIESIHARGRAHGYRTMIHALMYDGNPSARVLREESETVRRYELYGRNVVNAETTNRQTSHQTP